MRLATLLHTTPLALTALALLSMPDTAHAARPHRRAAEPQPVEQPVENMLTTYPVENARVTREVLNDHPVNRAHRICIEGPLPPDGFNAGHFDFHLRHAEPPLLDVLLKPVVEADGRLCTWVWTAVAAEPELTIEIRDVRNFYVHYLYYDGPLLGIPAKYAAR